MEAKFYEQEHCTIYGHGVWHYMIDCPVAHIHIIEYEGIKMQKYRKLFENYDAAEKFFQRVCKMLSTNEVHAMGGYKRIKD